MFTKHSAISSLLAEKRPAHEKPDLARLPGFVARLGDIKVETKEPGGDGAIDHVNPVDRYPD